MPGEPECSHPTIPNLDSERRLHATACRRFFVPEFCSERTNDYLARRNLSIKTNMSPILKRLLWLGCLLGAVETTVLPWGGSLLATTSRAALQHPAYGPPRPLPGYVKDAWTVWFRGREVRGASASTFVDLGAGYGKDAWSVFFEGEEVKEASAQSFAVLTDGYARDDWRVFWKGRVVADVSPASFATLGDGYARDNWKVLWNGRALEKASPASFEALGDGYARDNWKVFWCGNELPDAVPSSFEVLGRGYARDAWNTWYFGRPVERF